MDGGGGQKNYELSLKDLSFSVMVKGTVWPDWICKRVEPLDGIEKDINRCRFLIFLNLEYLTKVQCSVPLHAKMHPTSCLFGSRFACAQTAIFSSKTCAKNAGETSSFRFLAVLLKPYCFYDFFCKKYAQSTGVFQCSFFLNV